MENDYTVSSFGVMTTQANSEDEQVIHMWLHSRAATTQKAYLREARLFQDFVVKPLQFVSLRDVQGYMDSLSHLAPATQARSLNAIKSLLSFAYRIGYLPSNVAAFEKAPKIKNALSERILTQVQVHKMIALEECDRNRVILMTFYATGLRVSELCQLKWRDLSQRDGGNGQVTVFGKGGKTRIILIPQSAWLELQAIRHDAEANDPVFRSALGGHLSPSHVRRIVRAAAHKAGIQAAVSCHWLRHCHASHALDRGAALHLVQAGLGHVSAATTSKYLHARPDDGAGLYLGL